MTRPETSFTVKVDVTNPGQFFACCGLLELADRLWPGAEGWFGPDLNYFSIHVQGSDADHAPRHLLESFISTGIKNEMTDEQVQRRIRLTALSEKERKTQKLEDEKKSLDKLWRESAIVIPGCFDLRVDWFLDEYAGGSTFKTWAGQQSVIDIAIAMLSAIQSKEFVNISPEQWLTGAPVIGSVPFNFDATLGGQGSDLDMGFSRDPLGIRIPNKPIVELMAFIGLQRSRPIRLKGRNRYAYDAWTDPLCPVLVGALSADVVPTARTLRFAFHLLYRTKYLKSFLPATPIGACA